MNSVCFGSVSNIAFFGKTNQKRFVSQDMQDTYEFKYEKNLADNDELNKVLLNCGKSVKDITNKSLNNYINGGYTSDFYNIKDKNGKETGYLLAVSKTALKQIQDGIYDWQNKFQSIKDEYPGFNFGQCIAQTNGIRIHKKIEGIPSGVTYDTKDNTPEERFDYISNVIFDDRQNAQYDKHLERLKKLTKSQKCFDDFASQIIKMSETYMFDPFPNNVLVDTKNASLNIIDPTTKENSVQFQCHGNHLSGMLSSLFDPRYVKRQSAQARENGGVSSDTNPRQMAIRKEVLKKCLIAAKKNDMSFEKNPYTKDSENHEYCDLRYLFKISGLKPEEISEIFELEKMENPTAFFEFVENL